MGRNIIGRGVKRPTIHIATLPNSRTYVTFLIGQPTEIRKAHNAFLCPELCVCHGVSDAISAKIFSTPNPTNVCVCVGQNKLLS